MRRLSIILTGSLMLFPACFNPGDRRTPYERGVDYFDGGRFTEAAQEFRMELRAHPQNQDALFNLALTCERQNELAEARRNYAKLLEQNPAHARALVNLGRLDWNAGEKNSAIEKFEAASKAETKEPYVLMAYAYCLMRDDDGDSMERAEKLLNEAFQREPGNPALHYMIGNLYRKQGRIDMAKHSYEDSLRYNPENAPAMAALGEILMAEKDYSGALKMFIHSSALNPGHSRVFFNAGICYRELGQYSNSVMSLWRAEQMGENADQVRRELLLSYSRLIESGVEQDMIGRPEDQRARLTKTLEEIRAALGKWEKETAPTPQDPQR